MSGPVRVGLIGCGDIAVSQHVPALMNNPGASLVAVCDVNLARARVLADAHGVPCYTRVEHMLVQCPMDAVIVATPPWISPDVTIAALRAGLYVLCEKPMALNLDAAQAVADAERTSAGFVQLGFTYRHDPLLIQLRDWIAEGKLGRPVMIRMGVYDEIWDPAGNPEHYHRLFSTLEHGSPSIHDGAHNADFLHFLTGSRVGRVDAFGFQSRPEFPCSNYDISVIQFDNGDAAKLEVGWFFPALPYGEFEVLGPSGYAAYDRLKRFVRLQTPEESICLEDKENWWNLCFKLQLAAFIQSVNNCAPCVPGCAEGIYSLSLCKRIEDSMLKTGKGSDRYDRYRTI